MISWLCRVAAPGTQQLTGPRWAPPSPSRLGLGCGAAAPLWPLASQLRSTSAHIRRRRRAYHQALADPHVSLARVKKLRERSAVPEVSVLRHIGEHKIGKAVSYLDRKHLWYELRYKRYAPVFLNQVKPRMKFWTAALEEAQLPPARLPEIAMAGRSNSGKSTLINYLCGQHSAHVKRTPGSTTELVFWQIGKPASLCLVDLPGYGFAEAAEEKRLQWTEFTLWYVRARKNLRLVLILITGKAGIKPMDREMIAFLERHNVPWQIVVTKCDKVVRRDLAKRITLMKEDIADYRKMAGPPIPVSALKRRGMDELRELLGGLKVRKEVVKEGIRRRIYDLLEIRRQKRLEKNLRKKEAKEKAKEEAAAKDASEDGAAAAVEGVEADLAAAARASSPPWQAAKEDLHTVLADWGFDLGEASHRKPAAKAVGPAAAAKALGGDETTEGSVASKSHVTEAHYSLEDRDSKRMAGLARELFPDLQTTGGVAAAAVDEAAVAEGTAGGRGRRSARGRGLRDEDAEVAWPAAEGSRRSAFPGFAAGGGDRPGSSTSSRLFGADRELSPDRGDDEEPQDRGFSSDSDSESEGEAPSRTIASVVRYDPAPPVAAGRLWAGGGGGGGGGSLAAWSPPAAFASSPFPGLGSGPGRPPLTRTEVSGLREGWVRPPTNQDTLYDQDDFASESDRAGAYRLSAPPAPTLETRGSLLAQARRRYEREWAMELQDVEEVRHTAPDTSRAAVAGSSSPASAALLARAAAAVSKGAAASAPAAAKAAAARRSGQGGGLRKRIDKTGASNSYITQDGDKPLPQSKALWKVLGRPPSRVWKAKNEPDAAKILKAFDPRNKKRNLGSGITYEKAREKWMNWFKRNKKRNWDSVAQAPSPVLEDVEADYDDRTRKRRQFHQSPNGRSKRSPGMAGAGGGTGGGDAGRRYKEQMPN